MATDNVITMLLQNLDENIDIFIFRMSYQKKNPNGGGWGYTFLNLHPTSPPILPVPTPSPGIFRFITLQLEIPDKTSFHPWKFCKIVWHLFSL